MALLGLTYAVLTLASLTTVVVTAQYVGRGVRGRDRVNRGFQLLAESVFVASEFDGTARARRMSGIR